MTIGSYGKKRPQDKHMVIDLVFRFKNDPNPQIVELEYTKESMANALMICNTALVTFLSLEDCRRQDQHKHFEYFIHQTIEDFQELQRSRAAEGNTSGGLMKKTKQFRKPTLVEFDDKMYLVADSVFILGLPVIKLTPEEVDSLPVIISWIGPKYEFKTDPEAGFRLLVEIIDDFNSLQNPKFKSAPLAIYTFFMIGKFYPFIIQRRGNCSLEMSISGDATGTGKSLWQCICQNMLEGEQKSSVSSITDSSMYETLSEGPIFVKEFCSKKQPARMNAMDVRFLERAVKAIWERSSKVVNKATHTVNNMVYIDANIVPEDLMKDLDEATWSKIGFNYTGPDPLDGPDMSEKIARMLKKSKEAFSYLPLMLSYGHSCVLEGVTNDIIRGLEGVLRVPGDRKEAQRIMTYDLMYFTLKDIIELYPLPVPLLFQGEGIDRLCKTFFNRCDQDSEKMEELVIELLEEFSSDELLKMIDYSKRTEAFKLKKPELKDISKSLSYKLKDLKTTSSVFRGQRLRVIIFPEAMLSPDTIQKLHDLRCKYDEWLKILMEKQRCANKTYGEQFFFYSEIEENKSKSIRLDCTDGQGDHRLDSGHGQGDHRLDSGHGQGDQRLDSGDSTVAAAGGAVSLSTSMACKSQLMCENIYCQDYRKVFKFASHKARHDRQKYHMQAKKPNGK